LAPQLSHNPLSTFVILAIPIHPGFDFAILEDDGLPGRVISGVYL
jgi:hypothetical protein